MHRLPAFLLIAWGLPCVAFAAPRPAPAPVRILFVGNSLTYVGNLPAVLDAIAASSGQPTASAMIVKGGATLTERVADGSVARALQAAHYDDVVLQERGGDMVCAYAPERCRASEAALATLARISLAHGAKPILLGTYQGDADASRELVKSGLAAARRLSIAYVPLSERLQAATKAAPGSQWFYADGMHPGHDLVLLEATLLYRELFGALPRATTLAVHAPMFSPRAKFSAPSPTSEALPPQQNAQGYTYTAATVSAVLGAASDEHAEPRPASEPAEAHK